MIKISSDFGADVFASFIPANPGFQQIVIYKDEENEDRRYFVEKRPIISWLMRLSCADEDGAHGFVHCPEPVTDEGSYQQCANAIAVGVVFPDGRVAEMDCGPLESEGEWVRIKIEEHEQRECAKTQEALKKVLAKKK